MVPPLLLLALLPGGCRTPAPDPSGDAPAEAALAAPDPRFDALLDWTEARMDEWHIPGVALAVVADGQVHLAGLGVREFGRPEPVTPDTLFRVASVSKMFCGAIVAEEAAAGRLDLDAPASDWLGDLTLGGGHTFDEMTVLQLMSHESGIQSIGLPRACDTDPLNLGPAMAELTPEWDLWSPPGELYHYANQGYGLAGLAAERSAGVPFSELAQGLFDGSGMATATYDWLPSSVNDHATGHTMDLTTGKPIEYHGLEERACVASFPSGGLMASARDMSGALKVLLSEGEGWVSPEAWEIMTTQGHNRSETSGYGFGLGNSPYRDNPGYSHHGSLGGFFAMVWALPEAGVGVTVLVNADHSVVDPPAPWSKISQRIMEHALDTFLDLEPAEHASSVRPIEDWGRYVGFYHSDYELGNVAISLRGDELWYASETRAEPLIPYSRDSFMYATPLDDGRTQYTGVGFEDDEDGAITWLVTDIGLARRR